MSTKKSSEDDQLVSLPRGGDTGLGIDWNFQAFDGLINNRGEDVIHEVGMKCPCNTEDTHAGQIEQTPHVPRRRTILGCEKCRGDGYIYRRPQKIVALITGISEERGTRLEGGWAMPGDCVMSTRPGYLVSASDLITFLWPHPIPDGQTIVRGAGSTSDNTQKTLYLEENEDRLWYNAVDGIWCEDEDGNTYQAGADFQLDGSKIIRWVGGQPTKGKLYTIKYTGYLEWVVFSPPGIRRDRNRDIGSRVMLRKRHVAMVNEDPRPRVGDEIPFCARIQGC